jgi:hypothetical protein
MKAKFWMALFLILFFCTCQKDETAYQSTGIILGPDLGYCICCGGYVIEIENETYHFDSLPNSSNFNLLELTFPVLVNLNWEKERKCNEFQYIEITKIEIKN